MLFRLARVLAAIGLTVSPARGANIELTGYSKVQNVLGLKIEGEIKPGDALKLLTLYEYFGPAVTSTVFLWSRGGDVEEAIKIGRLIRRLRLETYAPSRGNIDNILNTILGTRASPTDSNNYICASACVLIYAAGARRTGDLLVLHRPYPPPEVTEKLSDVEIEAVERAAISTVRDYLQEMELDQYYTDKLISTSSQDGFIPSDKDLTDHPLAVIAPSLEEVILSKCESITATEEKYWSNHVGKETRKNNKVVGQLTDKFQTYLECETKQFNGLRLAAWIREHEARVDNECSLKMTNVPRQDAVHDNTDFLKKAIESWVTKYDSEGKNSEMNTCRERIMYQLTVEAVDRGFKAIPGDVPPSKFSPDASILTVQ